MKTASRAGSRALTVLPRGAVDQQGLRAGVVSRTIAMVFDALVVAAAGGALYLAVVAIRLMREPRRFTWPKVPWANAVAALGVLCVIYLAIGWSSTGRTVGTRMMGLRVVDPRGDLLRIVRSFARAFVCVVFPVGLFWSAVSRGNRSIQDLLFRTSVVYDWQSRVSSVAADAAHERVAADAAHERVAADAAHERVAADAAHEETDAT
jgi:uncharacterized RDD family membrane protein YckC